MQRISLNKLMLLIVMLISFCAVSPGLAEEADEGFDAPLSPGFLKWQEEQTKQDNSSQLPANFQNTPSESDSHTYTYTEERTEGHPNGYMPFPVDFSHLENNPPNEDLDSSPVPLMKADTLPSTFDLRNVNGKSYVTDIKNQNPYGSCWAHAAIGSMESNYLMQGKSELDLSEMHLAWFAYRNSDKSRAFNNLNNSSFSTVLNYGGNSFLPTALFARLSGPAGESDVPYGKDRQPSQSTPESYSMKLRLRDAYYLTMKSQVNVNSNADQRDIVKRRIMQNGSVVANYHNDDNAFNKTSAGGTAFHTTSTSPNHAIQIIGWDDNYSRSNFKTRPSIDGAWLIKNSWGTSWGDNGYFWMSYATNLVEGTSFIVEDVNSNMKVYEYDPLGMCSLWGYSGSTIYAANVFKSERNETLTEVGFYTGDNNMGYEIYVYTGMSEMPSSSPVPSGRTYAGTVAASGNFAYAGYHTVALDSPVSLTSGEYFSVVIKFTGYGMTAVEKAVSGFSNNAAIEEGSFFSSNGSSWVTGKSKSQNACIKAFTLSGTVSGIAPRILDGYPDDGKIGEAYSYTFRASGSDTITWSVSNGSLPGGLSLSSSGVLSGTPTTEENVTFTVKAANSYGSDSKTYTMNIFDLPSITTESIDGYVGYSLTGQLELNQSVTAKWYADDKLPSGLSLNANTGAITGRPSKAGEYEITFRAVTSLGESTNAVKIVIYEKPVKPVFKTSSLPQGIVDDGTQQDSCWYFQIIKIEGTYPINVSATGSLPAGLSLDIIDNALCLGGYPTSAGTFSFTLTAENIATELDNRTVSRTYRLVIKAQAPVIRDVLTLPEGKVGEAYDTYTFTTTAGTDPITWKASGLPSGMKFNDGKLSGTPMRSGKFNITITAKNSGGTDTLRVPLTVAEIPVITNAKFANATTDKKYTARLSARGTGTISWDVGGLPEGFTYSANSTGTSLTITGTPTEMGIFGVTLKVSNSAGSSTVNTFLTVNGVSPKFTAATLPRGTVDNEYTGSRITVTGTKPITIGYTISDSDKTRFGIDDLSDLGLSFSYDADEGTAKITGTPTKSIRSLPVSFTAENEASNGRQVVRKVSLTIAGERPAFTEPSASTVTMKKAVGEEIEIDFAVTGTPDIKLTMNNVSGFELTQSDNNNAKLTGTLPSRDGRVSITVTAANADGKATKRITIQAMTPPAITTASLADGTIKKNYTAKFAATGTKTIRWSVEGELPEGMRFSNGTISGNPKEAGEFELAVTASNDVGTDTKEFTLRITDPNAENNLTSLHEESESESESENSNDISNSEDNESESESESKSAITFGNERNEASLSAGQSSMLKENEYIIVKVLPEMKVSESGMYDINVELDESVETGAELIWIAFPKDAESSSDDEIAEFYDESGKEITSVPESHKFTAGVWLNEGITYEPVIAVKNKE